MSLVGSAWEEDPEPGAFSVAAITTCPHLVTAVGAAPASLALESCSARKYPSPTAQTCGHEESLLCLGCFEWYCGR